MFFLDSLVWSSHSKLVGVRCGNHRKWIQNCERDGHGLRKERELPSYFPQLLRSHSRAILCLGEKFPNC